MADGQEGNRESASKTEGAIISNPIMDVKRLCVSYWLWGRHRSSSPAGTGGSHKEAGRAACPSPQSDHHPVRPETTPPSNARDSEFTSPRLCEGSPRASGGGECDGGGGCVARSN